MSDDFKKLDDWMMDAAKTERERRVPEKELQDFHDGVMKKILERQNAASGFPYMGLAVVAAVSIAVIFGAVIYIQNVRVDRTPEAEIEVARQVSVAAPAQIQNEIPKAVPTVKVQAPPLTQASLVEEIEALKELGAWTEEDETEAGIPVEVTFSDIEAGINLQSAAPPAALQG